MRQGPCAHRWYPRARAGPCAKIRYLVPQMTKIFRDLPRTWPRFFLPRKYSRSDSSWQAGWLGGGGGPAVKKSKKKKRLQGLIDRQNGHSFGAKNPKSPSQDTAPVRCPSLAQKEGSSQLQRARATPKNGGGRADLQRRVDGHGQRLFPLDQNGAPPSGMVPSSAA